MDVEAKDQTSVPGGKAGGKAYGVHCTVPLLVCTARPAVSGNWMLINIPHGCVSKIMPFHEMPLPNVTTVIYGHGIDS